MMSSTLPVRRAGTLQAVSLLVLATFSVMAIALLAPILPQLIKQFGSQPGSEWLAPLILTAPSLTTVIFAPIVGIFGDKYGRRRLLIGCLAVYGFIGMAPIVLDNVVAILISRFCLGIAEAGVFTLSTALIGDYFKGAERDKWLGYQIGIAGGSAVLLIAAGGALGAFGWRAPFFFYAFALIACIVVWRVTWEPEQTSIVHAASALADDETKIPFPWGHMARVISVSLTGSILFYVVQLQAAVAFNEVGMKSPPIIGILTAIATLGLISGTIVFRYVSQKGIALLLAFAFILVAFGLIAAGLSRDYYVTTVAFFIGQVGCGIMVPTLLAWTVKGLDFAVRARGVGIWHGTFSISQSLSILTMTAVTLATGGALKSFVVLGIFSLAAAVVALGLLAHGRRRYSALTA